MFSLQYMEKRNFAKAETILDNLAQQIQDKVGKADEIKKEKSCDRANLKSEKGPFGCDVDISLFYTNKNSVEATEIMRNVSVIGGQSTLELLGRPVTAFVSKDATGVIKILITNSRNWLNLNVW